MEDSKFRKIGQFQYSSEAYIYKGKIESEGIQVIVRDNHTVDTDPSVSNAIGRVKLFVFREDFERAKEILLDISLFSVDNDGELLKCPNCGAEKIQLLTTIKDFKSFFSFLVTLFAVVLPLYTRYKYKCEVCNHEFS